MMTVWLGWRARGWGDEWLGGGLVHRRMAGWARGRGIERMKREGGVPGGMDR